MRVYMCVCVESALSKDFPWVVNTGCWKEREMEEWDFGERPTRIWDGWTFLHFVDGL